MITIPTEKTDEHKEIDFDLKNNLQKEIREYEKELTK